MSEITRREVLAAVAAAFAGAGAIDHGLARRAHALVRQAPAGAPYVPRLTAHQFLTLERLADLIIPVEDGRPGALGAGVPAWIDALLTVNTELRTNYAAGFAWLDATMLARHGRNFAAASREQQTALLDQIAYKKNSSPELDQGIAFFALVRRMTVDGFYTSDIGIRDINPGGRPPRQTFVVPQESIDYVIDRSPFK
jgi:hypothetical protein